MYFYFVENDIYLFESDIVLLDENNPQHTVKKRNAQRSRKYLWKDKTIPYVISQELGKKYVSSFEGRDVL